MIEPCPSTSTRSASVAFSRTRRSAAPAMKSATTASTAMPRPSIRMPVCPVAANAVRIPRSRSASRICSCVVILPMLQSVPTVSTIVASMERTRPRETSRLAGGRRRSRMATPRDAASAASSGTSAMKVCRPLQISSPCSMARATSRIHSAGSLPPAGAMPISRAFGFSARPSSSVATTGMSPPKPTTSPAVRPARVASMTPTTRSGVYRMQALAVLELSGPNRPSARIRKRWSRDMRRRDVREWARQRRTHNLHGGRRGAALEDRNHVEVRAGKNDASLAGRKPEDERSLARGAAESLPFVEARQQDAPHHHHDHGETRHGNEEAERTEELSDDEHEDDRQHRWQVDLLRHDEWRDDVALDQMHDGSHHDHPEGPRDPVRPPDDEQHGERGGEQRPEEGYHHGDAGEHGERERIRHVQHVQPDRGERREEGHREEQTHDVGTERIRAIGEHVAHEVAMERREQGDEPLAIQRGMDREIQRHHAHGEEADEHLDDAEYLRHDVVELTRELVVESEEQRVLAGLIDGGECRHTRHEAVDGRLPSGDVVRQDANELARLHDQRRDEDGEQHGEPA